MWQNIVYGVQMGAIRSLPQNFSTLLWVEKCCGITGSSQMKFCSWITLPLKLMSAEFRGRLQQQFGSLVFLFLSLLPFSILERKHQLKYGSCSMHSELQTCKLVMALSQRLTRLSYTKVCLESEVGNTHFFAIQYACRNGSVMLLLVLASY